MKMPNNEFEVKITFRMLGDTLEEVNEELDTLTDSLFISGIMKDFRTEVKDVEGKHGE